MEPTVCPVVSHDSLVPFPKAQPECSCSKARKEPFQDKVEMVLKWIGAEVVKLPCIAAVPCYSVSYHVFKTGCLICESSFSGGFYTEARLLPLEVLHFTPLTPRMLVSTSSVLATMKQPH